MKKLREYRALNEKINATNDLTKLPELKKLTIELSEIGESIGFDAVSTILGIQKNWEIEFNHSNHTNRPL